MNFRESCGLNSVCTCLCNHQRRWVLSEWWAPLPALPCPKKRTKIPALPFASWITAFVCEIVCPLSQRCCAALLLFSDGRYLWDVHASFGAPRVEFNGWRCTCTLLYMQCWETLNKLEWGGGGGKQPLAQATLRNWRDAFSMWTSVVQWGLVLPTLCHLRRR